MTDLKLIERALGKAWDAYRASPKSQDERHVSRIRSLQRRRDEAVARQKRRLKDENGR